MNVPARLRAELPAWAVAIAAAAAVLAVTAYRSRDPDSTLYANLSARLSTLPLGAWLAPEWWEWGPAWEKSGLFREHPIGIFVLPALLARSGYPAAHAAYAVGALMSALAIVLIGRVVASVAAEHEAVGAQWACLILPVAFVYRVRANQEYPVLVLTLIGLLATDRARRALPAESSWPSWAIMAAAACGLALVKGIFVVFLPVVCALWLLLVPPAGEASAGWIRLRRSDRTAWLGIGLGIVAVAVAGVLYERVYQSVTGQSFLSYYLRERLAANAGLGAGRETGAWRRLGNLPWYGVRLLWFGAPGTFVLLLSGHRLGAVAGRARGALTFALVAALAYVVAMSTGANRADRFIFPAYFMLGAAGAGVAMRRWGVVDRAARALAALPPYALPAAWMGLFLLTLVSALAGSR